MDSFSNEECGKLTSEKIEAVIQSGEMIEDENDIDEVITSTFISECGALFLLRANDDHDLLAVLLPFSSTLEMDGINERGLKPGSQSISERWELRRYRQGQ